LWTRNPPDPVKKAGKFSSSEISKQYTKREEDSICSTSFTASKPISESSRFMMREWASRSREKCECEFFAILSRDLLARSGQTLTLPSSLGVLTVRVSVAISLRPDCSTGNISKTAWRQSLRQLLRMVSKRALCLLLRNDFLKG